jgi:hypothetical protein
MPITGEQVTIVYKLLPLTLSSDGTASISVRRGLLHASGMFECLSEVAYFINTEDTSSVLDAPPIYGLSRRDDLSFAVYNYCVSKGYVTGIIS